MKFSSHLSASIRCVSFVVLLLGSAASTAQEYPSKPIRIVTSAAGGGSDFIARLVAQGITGPLGQPVVIENRGGSLSAETVSKAPADGYTLLLSGGTFYIASLLQKTPYDPIKDFAPVTITSSAPNVLVVHPSLPVKSVKELIALARARPGQLNYGSGLVGSASLIAGELFKSLAGANMVQVSYKGSAASITALLSGEIQLTFSDISPVEAHIKAGRLRAIAVTSAQPSTLLPGVPAIAATVPGYEFISLTGVMAPARTPDAVIKRLNQEIVRVVKTPQAREKFLSTGSEVVGSSPEELAAWIKTDMARIGKVIKETGMKVE